MQDVGAEPVVIRSLPLLLAGISAELPARSAPPPERPRVIQELSRSFLSKISAIGNRQGAERYSIIENDVTDNGKPPWIRVMIAVRSFENLPTWCERFTIQPGRYAVFEHRGLPRDLSKTVADIQARWSPRIPGLFQSDLEIVVYPPGYDPVSSDSTFAYWLPLP